ncbi:hypothetical protein OS493_035269, partial [Desmophyllum pertusum]
MTTPAAPARPANLSQPAAETGQYKTSQSTDSNDVGASTAMKSETGHFTEELGIWGSGQGSGCSVKLE